MIDHKEQTRQESRAVWRLAGYILGTIFVSVLMLAVNAGMVFGLAKKFEEGMSRITMIEPLTQLAIFICPVLLLFLEWQLWDILSGSRSRNQAGG